MLSIASALSRRPQSGLHSLGRDFRRGDGCVITSIAGRHSTHPAVRYSTNDNLTVLSCGIAVQATAVAHFLNGAIMP
jgi:hypothetical protein